MKFSRMLNVVDCHAEGESGKVVVGGVGNVPGETMFDKRVYLEQNLDQLRELLLFEPRGAVWHNANIVLPSNTPEAALGFVILESTEYPAMSGSNTMCVATVLLETGMLPMQEPVTELVLESPAGLIRVHCECRDGKVIRAKLYNQPAFVYYLDEKIDVPGVGALRVDVAYGGMTYVLVNAADVGFDLNPDEARALCELGQRIKTAAAEQLAVEHPTNPDIPGITQTAFTGPVHNETDEQGQPMLRSRNAVIVSPGRVDRSPMRHRDLSPSGSPARTRRHRTGSAVSARVLDRVDLRRPRRGDHYHRKLPRDRAERVGPLLDHLIQPARPGPV